MAKSISRFNAALEPVTAAIPSAVAEAVGRGIARHTYLEWILGQVLYSLLEISIKQGRKVVQRPTPAAYAAAVQGLFAFHKLDSAFDFADLARRVERADAARDALAHSVYMQDVNSRKPKLHLVHGSWAREGDYERMARDAWPEAPVIDRALLGKLRKDIEDAVARAEKLRDHTDGLLRKLHEKRRTDPKRDRRRR